MSLSSSRPSRSFLRNAWRAVLSAGRLRGARLRNQHVEDALLGGVLGAGADLAHLGLARLLDGQFREVADDGVDVLAHVADLGELGRFDLDEGRIGEPRQPARDLGLAHAGGADHQDVLGRDLAAQLLVDLLAAPAVAQGDRDGALGIGLADDVAIEFGDDFLRGHGGHGAYFEIGLTGREGTQGRKGKPKDCSASSRPRICAVQSISIVWFMFV